MKWRQSIIYLVVLVLVGGYFYYFEVVKKGEKEAAEKEAKKIFHLQANDVRGLEITSGDQPAVKLQKDGQWKIVEPIRTDADKIAIESLTGALANLTAQKEVAATAPDLNPYGLVNPSLKLRITAGDRSFDLLFGEKNPTGDASYAKTGDKPNVFLVQDAALKALGKGLNDLRRKELLTFGPEDVKSVKVAWKDGGSFSFELQDDGKTWKSLDKPDMAIKPTKVTNLLEQLHWMRATSFLENEPVNLGTHGLDSPIATVTLRLKDDRTAELKLGTQDDKKRLVAALSSDLPAVALVSAGILQDIPKDPKGLEDLSFVSVESGEVKQVKYQKGEFKSDLVRLEENKWGIKKGEGQPKEFKDSWRVGSLLWDFKDTEFEGKAPQNVTPIPEKPYSRIELWSADKCLAAITWEAPPSEDEGLVTVWVQKDGTVTEGKAKPDTIRRIDEDLNLIDQSVQGKDGA